MLNRQLSGFSLLEVLVALAVLSIGFVGYAALQVVGIQSSQDSYQRSQIVLQVEELAERMRANRPGASAPDPAAPGNLISFYDADSKTGTPSCSNAPTFCDDNATGVRAASCTAAQMATFDVWVTYCGYPDASGVPDGGLVSLVDFPRLEVACALDGAGNCISGAVHTLRATWKAIETDRDPDKDQDGDNDKEYATQTVQITVMP